MTSRILIIDEPVECIHCIDGICEHPDSPAEPGFLMKCSEDTSFPRGCPLKMADELISPIQTDMYRKFTRISETLEDNGMKICVNYYPGSAASPKFVAYVSEGNLDIITDEGEYISSSASADTCPSTAIYRMLKKILGNRIIYTNYWARNRVTKIYDVDDEGNCTEVTE